MNSFGLLPSEAIHQRVLSVIYLISLTIAETVYGKTFEGENFCGFLVNLESFSLNHLLCTVHNDMGLMHRESFLPRKFCRIRYLLILPRYHLRKKGIIILSMTREINAIWSHCLLFTKEVFIGRVFYEMSQLSLLSTLILSFAVITRISYSSWDIRITTICIPVHRRIKASRWGIITSAGSYAPIKVLPHLPPCGQCGGIRGDLTSLKGNFPYRGAKFSVKSPTFPLLQCGVWNL